MSAPVRSCVPDPPDRLGQEVGGAPDGVGPALAQTCHQDIAGSCGHREEGVIATHPCVPVVERAFLRQAVCLADRRVEIDREGCGSRAGACSPGSSQ